MDDPLLTTKILAAEDFEPYQQLVLSILRSHPELEVVASASNGLEAVEKARELRPDVILMDIGLPGINGLEAARRICQLLPESKIIFLTQESSPEVVQEAMRLGACGFVLKTLAESDLLTAIQAALKGHKFFSDGTGHQL
jgi:DNA-binding NarL/FixJ family response regulator